MAITITFMIIFTESWRQEQCLNQRNKDISDCVWCFRAQDFCVATKKLICKMNSLWQESMSLTCGGSTERECAVRTLGTLAKEGKDPKKVHHLLNLFAKNSKSPIESKCLAATDDFVDIQVPFTESAAVDSVNVQGPGSSSLVSKFQGEDQLNW